MNKLYILTTFFIPSRAVSGGASDDSSSDQVTQPPADPCVFKHFLSDFTLFAKSQTHSNQ